MTDPIQHLRELMAKSPHRPWTLHISPSRMKWGIGGTRRPVIDGDFAGDWPVDKQELELRMIVALVNLAPQLLEVVEKARIYRKTMDEYREAVNSKTPMRAIPFVAAVAEAEKELDEALAALGGKGGDAFADCDPIEMRRKMYADDDAAPPEVTEGEVTTALRLWYTPEVYDTEAKAGMIGEKDRRDMRAALEAFLRGRGKS